MAQQKNKPVRSSDKPLGLRSVEYFNHFQCGACSKWWGIGDAPSTRKDWFCPWCGKENRFGLAKRVDLSAK